MSRILSSEAEILSLEAGIVSCMQGLFLLLTACHTFFLQVIQLLRCMNLEQYKDQFMREQVDGEILAECDEVMLESELSVHSAIHRTRLLKVITGKHSALGFIQEGADLYSTLDHRI